MSLLLGGLWRLVEYRAWMPLSGYRVDAQDPALEERLWSVFPSRCFRFWPYFLKDAEGLKQFLERDIPVSVVTTMPRVGRFATAIKRLTPWLKVRWYDQLWCVSREGRMWNVAEAQGHMASADLGLGPTWRLPQLKEDGERPPSVSLTFRCRWMRSPDSWTNTRGTNGFVRYRTSPGTAGRGRICFA